MYFGENAYFTYPIMAFEDVLIHMVLKNIPLECQVFVYTYC